MTTMTAIKLHDVLNKQLANYGLLYVKLHHYHWFVKGNGFFELHGKFEELYDEAAEILDQLAERLLMIGGKPYSTLREFLEHAELTEAKGGETAEQMVQQTIDDFKVLAQALTVGIKAAQDEEDEGTADLFIGIQSSLEKQIWMLSAYLA